MFKASAPGSLMLLGEYAVLHGKQALVCAVDKRMQVKLIPRTDKKIFLKSALGDLETDLSHLESKKPFQFVLTTLLEFKKRLSVGCEIEIESEFSSTIGFASSAAVTVATLKALTMWLGLSMSDLELVRQARKIVRKVQGLGSGADVAACVMGGVVAYRMQPFTAEKLPFTPALTVVYSGSKTTTVDAVNFVEKRFAKYPVLFRQIITAIDQCVVAAIAVIRQGDNERLGELFDVQQGLMDALGVNTPRINNIIDMLRQQPLISGAKISGSGLGDCVIGLGDIADDQLTGLSHEAHLINVAISEEGVVCEKI